MSDLHVPAWAHRARTVFQTLGVAWGVWVVLSLTTNLVFGWLDDVRDDPPLWVLVATIVFVTCWWGSGLVWLAGKAVGGYREGA